MLGRRKENRQFMNKIISILGRFYEPSMIFYNEKAKRLTVEFVDGKSIKLQKNDFRVLRLLFPYEKFLKAYIDGVINFYNKAD